jgi:hypothetical protein
MVSLKLPLWRRLVLLVGIAGLALGESMLAYRVLRMHIFRCEQY